MIQKDDNLVTIILSALEKAASHFQDNDVLVVTSKIVSKAEGRKVDLSTIKPSEDASKIADETQKDPRLVEMVLRESTRISRKRTGVLITEHRLGFTCANAGIDQSNIEGGEDIILLLPENPDKSAKQLRDSIFEETGVNVGIVISDSHGRPFRMGNTGVGIGVAGVPALLDLRGQDDLFGRTLQVSTQGYADLIASAAQLVSGEGNEGYPVILVRGLQFPPIEGKASDLNRPADMDLYR